MSKKFTERLGFASFSSRTVLVLLFLGVILFDIFSKGIGVISWKFLSQPPQQGMTEGGIFPGHSRNFPGQHHHRDFCRSPGDVRRHLPS